MTSFWERRRVVVTGGASFIGSHLVEALITRGASVHVVDDLSKGLLENLNTVKNHERFSFQKLDLLDSAAAVKAVTGMQIVFHLAARHGGRYYIEKNRLATAENYRIDDNVFAAALEARVERVIFSSSACIYPRRLQTEEYVGRRLVESDALPPDDPDQEYGAAKLQAERTLQRYINTGKIQGVSCRYFTVYGPRSPEDHSVTALVAKGLRDSKSIEVWGDGSQVRSWVYVDDVISGTIKAAECIIDGTGINIGSEDALSVNELTARIVKLIGTKSEIYTNTAMPAGPAYRVPDIGLAKSILDWQPQVPLSVGLSNVIGWYRSKPAITESRLRKRLQGDLTISSK